MPWALTNHDGHEKILLEQAANERKLRLKLAIESQRKRAQIKRSKITKLEAFVKFKNEPLG